MYGAYVPPPPSLESDDSLRKRLQYVAGGKLEPRIQERIEVSRSSDLDAIAEEYALRRRRL